MAGILDGMRVIEGSAFVAAPLGGMTMAQLGADVIRFDPIGGGLDRGRWPVTADGRSLFWAGLNKGKRSIQVDLRSAEGRELVSALITAPGPDAGLFLTNFPARGLLDYEALAARRTRPRHGEHRGQPRRLLGRRLHGQPGHRLPVGHRSAQPVRALQPPAPGVGRHHRHDGRGRPAGRRAPPDAHRRGAVRAARAVRRGLLDGGNLGKIAEVQINRHERPKDGNYLYGAFGRDFLTADGRRIMIVALTARQWKGLVEATGLGEAFDTIEKLMGVDLDEEGGRFAAREVIGATLKPWVLPRTMAELRETFDAHGVSWGPYQTFTQLVEEDPRCSPANPMFDEVEQPGIGTYLMPASPLDFSGCRAAAPRASAGARPAHRRGAGRGAGPGRRRDRRAVRARRRGGAAAGARLTLLGAFVEEALRSRSENPQVA